MDVPPKLAYAAIGALMGALATLGAAVLRYITGQDKADVERQRMQADIEDTLRDDLFGQYKDERKRRRKAQAEAAEYKEEVGDLREKIDQMGSELDAVENRLDAAEAHAAWCEERLMQVDACLEEESDVDWGVEDV